MDASPEIQQYFASIDAELQRVYAIATKARTQGFDPEPKVDIPVAKNMAERVEGLISVVTPLLQGSGMTNRIHELEQEHGILSWKVALLIAEEVAKEKFCKFTDVREAMEIGIRVGFTYHTLGIVAAPLEGFIDLKIKRRKDGKEYVSPCYAGPIRGAGGTAAAFSVILTDYVRTKMGYAAYDPTEEEINHIVTEINDYHDRVTNLQYFPSEDELRFLLRHVPVEISGDPTETLEVSNHKDAGRIEENLIRGGVCLVTAEGLSQKAPKLWVRLKEWGKQFSLEWDWLEEFVTLQKSIKAKQSAPTKGEKPKISPNYTYVADIVAGRPVLANPMAAGGLRLRYGRSRFSGFSSAAVHPATFGVLNKYFATGTQLKVERPGKATALTICDTVNGPIVKLTDGSVERIQSETRTRQISNEIQEILFLGDILYSYGDFSVNGHPLVPAGYCPEWWNLELQKAMTDKGMISETLATAIRFPTALLTELLAQPFSIPPFDLALALTKHLTIPLHPEYVPYWNCITVDQFRILVDWVLTGKRTDEPKIIIPIKPEPKRLLELIGFPHIVSANEYAVIEGDHALALTAMLGLDRGEAFIRTQLSQDKPTLELVAALGVPIRDTAGTFIGSRMGRPEKAKMRELTGRPQVLFPVGEQGGVMRSFQEALSAGKVHADFPLLHCPNCNAATVYRRCDQCGAVPIQRYHCRFCGPVAQEKCQHGVANKYARQDIDIARYFNGALKLSGMGIYPDLIKGVTGTSNKDHIPEHLVKGILRAKHNVAVNKDGTTRYDMTELPITHFRPQEVRTSVERLRELGYTHDCKGQVLERPDQVCELKPQDIILSSSVEALDDTSDKVLGNVANFVDELLVTLYHQEPYYRISKPSELVGHLIVGLAPHISTGIIGRIIGFSDTQGFLAHPLFHAAMRRDCDGDEACVILLMDALLNFSRQFLPNNRGGRTMDSPLVLTSVLAPAEVDDMAHGLDTVWQYPLELYEAALLYKDTKEVKIEQIKHRLGKPAQYEGMGYTHELTSINAGNNCSAYKTLPSMEEKLRGQMELADKIRAVDAKFVAELVIEKHFIKDIKGNLRKFSTQQFRCVKCNEKFRRPPLFGKCLKCSGKLIFTVTEGSVIKYLEPSMSLARKYNLSPYLYQTLEITQRRIEGVFGREKEKQVGLGAWFG